MDAAEETAADIGFALFETAQGACGIAWGDAGLVGVQLPEASAAATRRRMRQRFPQAAECVPPPEAAAAIGQVQALMRGEAADFSAVRLDWRGVPEFHRRVYALTVAIAPGTTRSYGQIAHNLGEPGAARAVGRALGLNPFAPIVPCHRVLGSHGWAGGFSAHGGTEAKLRLLALEGARPPQDDAQAALF